MIVHPRSDNKWLFRKYRWDELGSVDRWRDSVSTMEREEEERSLVAEYRSRRRSPITEWSDLADPFEAAGWADWSPVRSVRLATAGKRPSDPEYSTFLALRRQRRREAQEAGTSS